MYFRKEGRALGEVTKYLVYNMRKRQEGGDKAKSTNAVSFDAIDATPRSPRYFNCTRACRCTGHALQALMPDVLHWLGITKIHNLSHVDMKCVARVREVLHAAGTPSTRPYHAGTTPSSSPASRS